MKIIVLDLIRVNEDSFVSFQCDSGEGIAKWMNKRSPIVNNSYDVEFDIYKTISETIQNRFKQIPENALSIDGNTVFIFGALESIEDDGMAYLRLSTDCLIMIETGEASFNEGEKILLKIEHCDLEVTAQGYR